MPKLTPTVRDALRTEYLSRVHGTYIKGEVLTNCLRNGPGVCVGYVNFLEDNYMRTENDPLLNKELIKFSCLKEMAEYVYEKPLTRWQMNQLDRWEESRKKVCPDVLLVIDPVKEEPDETEKLRKEVHELKEVLQEREAAYKSRVKELQEAHRKLRKVKMVANISDDEEEDEGF